MEHSTKGYHVVVDVYGVSFEKLDDEKLIEDMLMRVAKEANMTLISIASKKFEPQGVTVLGLLEESHISAHTYPEANYGAFDIFTCGDSNPTNAMTRIVSETLEPKDFRLIVVHRGDYEEGLRFSGEIHKNK